MTKARTLFGLILDESVTGTLAFEEFYYSCS